MDKFFSRAFGLVWIGMIVLLSFKIAEGLIELGMAVGFLLLSLGMTYFHFSGKFDPTSNPTALLSVKPFERRHTVEKYRVIKALRAGEVVDLEGIRLVMDEGEIEPGDLYVAASNTGPKLLTAREVVRLERGDGIDFIHATTPDYSFDGSDCVKVREA